MASIQEKIAAKRAEMEAAAAELAEMEAAAERASVAGQEKMVGQFIRELHGLAEKFQVMGLEMDFSFKAAFQKLDSSASLRWTEGGWAEPLPEAKSARAAAKPAAPVEEPEAAAAGAAPPEKAKKAPHPWALFLRSTGELLKREGVELPRSAGVNSLLIFCADLKRKNCGSIDVTEKHILEFAGYWALPAEAIEEAAARMAKRKGGAAV